MTIRSRIASAILSFGVLAAALSIVEPARAQKRRAVRPPGPPMLALDCRPAELPALLAEQCRAIRLAEGKRLFESETFGGNGRTCATCHSGERGTFSVDDVKRRLAGNPSDPLFVHDALDDGLTGTSRIEQDATIRVTLPMPPHLSVAGKPEATHVTFHRGVPTTMNTPALDTHLMWDLRESTLAGQARGAIRGHAQSTIEPTALQLELIAEFQQNDQRFFSAGFLQHFARTGAPPQLPEGTTDSEKRGRQFFVDQPFSATRPVGACALCHSGPMLNEANFFSTRVFGNPNGTRIFSVGVSERNIRNNPQYTFEIRDGSARQLVTTPDIGILMTDLATAPILAREIPPPGAPPGLAFFANFFKTPTLWGVKHTAPYFHDNSAKDFDEMLEHYNWFFKNGPAERRFQLTPEQLEDIKAYMNLL